MPCGFERVGVGSYVSEEGYVMPALVEILYSFVGVPTNPFESMLLYTGAVILSFVLLGYGLRILSYMVGALKEL